MGAKLACPYCGAAAVLEDSAVVYGRSYGPIWLCADYPRCDAYVGCHPGTTRPLGRLADPALREAKKRAHAVFDPLWQRWADAYRGEDGALDRKLNASKLRRLARTRAYEWLAAELRLSREECHIGLFGTVECGLVVSRVLGHRMNAAKVRAWAKARRAAGGCNV